MRLPMGSFAESCFEQNSIKELETILDNGIIDTTDCREWNLTEEDYLWNIKVALNELKSFTL